MIDLKSWAKARQLASGPGVSPGVAFVGLGDCTAPVASRGALKQLPRRPLPLSTSHPRSLNPDQHRRSPIRPQARPRRSDTPRDAPPAAAMEQFSVAMMNRSVRNIRTVRTPPPTPADLASSRLAADPGPPGARLPLRRRPHHPGAAQHDPVATARRARQPRLLHRSRSLAAACGRHCYALAAHPQQHPPSHPAVAAAALEQREGWLLRQQPHPAAARLCLHPACPRRPLRRHRPVRIPAH